MQAYNALIFDLDGTLWDTTEGCQIAWNQVAHDMSLDRTFSLRDMQKLMGKTSVEIKDMFFPNLHDETHETFMKRVFATSNHAIVKHQGWKLYDGVQEGLEALSKQYPMYLVSNCQVGYIEAFEEATGLVNKYFKDVEYFGRTGNPKGQNLRDLIHRNQLETPLYIGDTNSDLEASRQANIDFAWAAYGFGSVAHEGPSFDDFQGLVQAFLERASHPTPRPKTTS